MSDREEWPAWARQNEAPVAVMDEYTMWRRPDGNGFVTAIYADGDSGAPSGLSPS